MSLNLGFPTSQSWGVEAWALTGVLLGPGELVLTNREWQ